MIKEEIIGKLIATGNCVCRVSDQVKFPSLTVAIRNANTLAKTERKNAER